MMLMRCQLTAPASVERACCPSVSYSRSTLARACMRRRTSPACSVAPAVPATLTSAPCSIAALRLASGATTSSRGAVACAATPSSSSGPQSSRLQKVLDEIDAINKEDPRTTEVRPGRGSLALFGGQVHLSAMQHLFVRCCRVVGNSPLSAIACALTDTDPGSPTLVGRCAVQRQDPALRVRVLPVADRVG